MPDFSSVDFSGLVCFALEQKTISTSALGLTSATFAPDGQKAATAALITNENDTIRWRCDGGDATDVIGHELKADKAVSLGQVDAMSKFSAIKSDGATGDSIITVSYWR